MKHIVIDDSKIRTYAATASHPLLFEVADVCKVARVRPQSAVQILPDESITKTDTRVTLPGVICIVMQSKRLTQKKVEIIHEIFRAIDNSKRQCLEDENFNMFAQWLISEYLKAETKKVNFDQWIKAGLNEIKYAYKTDEFFYVSSGEISQFYKKISKQVIVNFLERIGFQKEMFHNLQINNSRTTRTCWVAHYSKLRDLMREVL